MTTQESRAAVRDDLSRRFRTVTRETEVGGRRVELFMPANADDLIREDDFVRDERLPYWADLWPSAIVLSTWLETHPVPLKPDGSRPRALELGCGLGLVTTAATRAGYDVLATDYYADATLLTARNALSVTGREPARLQLGAQLWRDALQLFVCGAPVAQLQPALGGTEVVEVSCGECGGKHQSEKVHGRWPKLKH